MKTLDLEVALPETIALSEASKQLAPCTDPVATELVSLGRFQLLAELGRGGMGRVLEARDPELRRSVAVKVIIDSGRVTEAQLARFVAEAQITSQLQHPNIVPVYEMGTTPGGEVFFAMRTAMNGAN